MPISWINGLYKIIAKVLSAKLKVAMSDVIISNQTTFI